MSRYSLLKPLFSAAGDIDRRQASPPVFFAPFSSQGVLGQHPGVLSMLGCSKRGLIRPRA